MLDIFANTGLSKIKIHIKLKFEVISNLLLVFRELHIHTSEDTFVLLVSGEVPGEKDRRNRAPGYE